MDSGVRLRIPPLVSAGAQVTFVCDDRGSILEAEEAIVASLGRDRDSMRGQPLARLADPDDAREIRRGLAEARQRGISTFSAHLRARHGAAVDLSMTAWAIEALGRRLMLCLAAPTTVAATRAEERARCLADTQKVIATILELALADIPLDELLERSLDLILSIPWLSIERTGAIFMVEHEPDALVMKVHRGLRTPLLSSCARVPFGACLCGQAALHREPVYAPALDERHTTRYSGIVPHGHYCVPICSGNTTLGVITTYLPQGHESSALELEFLTAVADTLAGVLMRRRADGERHRAERASRAKSELLALVSHELLTPVTAVMMSCERLQRDRATPLAPRHAEILRRMKLALGGLASTIRSLLEHARFDGGSPIVRMEAVDLAELAARVVDEVRPLAAAKGLTAQLALEAPLPKARTDESLLKAVLAILASNAVKFTQEGSVAVKVAYRDGAHRVSVEDSGPGIPDGERVRIFEAFEPLEPLAKKHVPGMGLGLALARRLVTALGARLELEPSHRAGSTFVVTLPRSEDGKGALVPR